MEHRTVFIIDGDELISEEVVELLSDVGYEATAYSSAHQFLLEHGAPSGVVVMDLRLKGMSGLLLQRKLQANLNVETIFMSGVAQVEDAVSAMKAGAFEFLVKPFRPQALIDAVGAAFEQLWASQLDRMAADSAKLAYESLSDAEREIAQLLASGLRNKQVAHFSSRAESTVKVHRARIMKKMGVQSLAELVRQLQHVGLG
ncbi:response regulator transcription factor [Sphingomonas pituitosa]|uniref:response regulator transcription factor n=1 Tax=Sphingomonas pituitosa TaxID=99597 RepID=UPI00082E007A|nr:response regulator [Sphingomonas pituitosa]